MTPTGRVSIAGRVFSPGGWPTTPNAFQPTYNGGQIDGVATTFDLYLEGVSRFGSSNPACLGPLTMNVTEMPAPGASRFAFWCSGAPPLANGWWILNEALAAPTSVGRLGLLTGFSGPLARIPVQSDAFGYVETPYPLTSQALGYEFAGLYFFRNTLSCTGSSPLSWSNALKIKVSNVP